jgi:uncharacterized protein
MTLRKEMPAMTLDTEVRTAAASIELEREDVPTDQVADGSPQTGLAVLGEFAGTEIGVWEMTAGAMRDIEADEVFVVLAGRATVQFQESDDAIVIQTGDVVRLRAGQRTLWTVTETLRKVYVTPAEFGA